MLLKTLVISAILAPSLAFAAVGKIERVGMGTNVKVSRSGAALRLKEGDALESGDELATDANTAVDIRLEDDTLIRVGVNSSYKVEASSKFHMLMHHLVSGVVRVLVKPTDRDHKDPTIKFRMQTPEGTIGVRGTEFVVLRAGGKTQLKGLDGEVLFGPADSDLASGYVSVGRGFESEIGGTTGPAKAQKFNLREYLNQINGPGGPFGPLSARVSGTANRHARAQSPTTGASVARNEAPPPAPPPPVAEPEPKKEKKPSEPKDWQTLLVRAALEGDKKEVKEALKHGADINMSSAKAEGHTALQAALSNNQKDMFVFLIQNGADVDLADAKGITPLMTVATEHLDMAYAYALLYPGGADYLLANGEGKTAAELAKQHGYDELYRYLTSKEAEDDVRKAKKEQDEKKK